MPTINGQEAAAIADKLRGLKTESEGLAYLGEVARNNEDRKLIAKALKIDGSGSMTTDKLLTQIVRHAIGARRTFTGLASW
ncbi:hypothetical protein [Catenuloplanes japonicus]|uniref:hypothetical protein n=1 Tax=Catenuloplanes japonicus TaxID=33876 RepID=UPI000B1EC952|nr:hypothetical protein [Catenuloplanes japonicus]